MNESYVKSPYVDPETGEIREDAPVLDTLGVDNLGAIARQIKTLTEREDDLRFKMNRELDRIRIIYNELIAKCEDQRVNYTNIAQSIMDQNHIEKQHFPGCGRFRSQKTPRKVFETPLWATLSPTEQQDIANDFGDLFKVAVTPKKAEIKKDLQGCHETELEKYFALTPESKKFVFVVEKGE